MSNWKELLTLADFRKAQRMSGFMVITDTAASSKVHRLSCPSVKESYFKSQVVINSRRNGKYYWIQNLSQASTWGAEPCRFCNR